MPKIAMLGAGSLVFCQTLVRDILSTDALADSEVRLIDLSRSKLDDMQSYVERVINENDLPAKVWSTTDRREALKDADFVVVMIQVGGVGAFKHDYEIPLKYGVDQCIADSLGPGGIFRGLRTIPVLVDVVNDMQELCPDAVLLNYANPMGACCTALGRVMENGQFVGLCHGIQTTLDLISSYVEVPKNDIDFLCAGINHMGWFLSLHDKRDGRDLQPILREVMEKPEYYKNEKVRAEVMRHFGYFMTESTGHLSEYVPWFRSSQRGLETYCDEPDFGGASGAYYKFCSQVAEVYKSFDYLGSQDAILTSRSCEYCSYIIESVTTGKPFRMNGNVRNDGYITNLPDGCCVEIPLYVDNHGLHPLRIGNLPTQCAALNQSNITVQTLCVESAMTGDPELAMQAVAMDPLTSAVCTLKEIREMTAELMAAEAQWLPQFEGKSLRATPAVNIPADVTPVEVPLDPALAIANRFGELAEGKK